MSNKERAEKWLNLVTEDLSVAEDLFKTGHWLYKGLCVIKLLRRP